jgi:hypothetical protein
LFQLRAYGGRYLGERWRPKRRGCVHEGRVHDGRRRGEGGIHPARTSGCTKFKVCDWKRRKAKRKATIYPIQDRTAHLNTSACANPLRRPAMTVHARVRAALSSRKSSSRRRGLILSMSAKSIFPQLPAARSELAALHRANP